jgi:DNA-binding NarL/FixJ family response regulator
VTMLDKISIFLLTENRLVREALVRIFGHQSDLHVVGATSLSSQIVSEIAASAANILVSDSSTNMLSELEIVPELHAVAPELRVVLIGMEPDPAIFLRAVRAGVVGYVLKDASSADVARAVRSVAADEAVCPPSLCMCLFKGVAQRNCEAKREGALRAKHPFGLTRREQQLVGLIERGLTNKEIAGTLNLSEQTIKNHVHSLLKKVGASDRLEAAELCRDNEDDPDEELIA